MSQEFETNNEIEDYEFDENNNEFDDDEDAGSWTDDSNCFPDDDNENNELPQDAMIENEYHEAYYSIKEAPANALKTFRKVIALCNEYDGQEGNTNTVLEFRFKALTQAVKLSLKHDIDMAMQYYTTLLQSTIGIRPNDVQTSIVSILSLCDNQLSGNKSLLDSFYDITLLELRRNCPLWFKIAKKRCFNLMSHEICRFADCKELTHVMYDYVLNEYSQFQKNVSTELLQVYSVKIMLIMKMMDYLNMNSNANNNNNNKCEYQTLMKELLSLVDAVEALKMEEMDDVIDAGATAVIHECVGKYVHCPGNDWQTCYSHFQNAFFAYASIADNDRGILNLKYLLLSYMILLCQSSGRSLGEEVEVPNPFSMNEVRVYERHIGICNMKALVDCVENHDVDGFYKYFAKEWSNQNGDAFLHANLKRLKLEFQAKALIKLSSSYKRMKLDWLARELEMDLNEIERLVVNLIMDERIYAKLDQVNMRLLMDCYDVKNSQGGGGGDYNNPLLRNMTLWMDNVNQIRSSICNKSSQRSGHSTNDQFGMMMDDYYDDEFLLSRPFVFAN